MIAGNTLLEMFKYIESNIKNVNDEADRKILAKINQSKIFKGELNPKELAILLRVYRDLKAPALKPKTP